MQAEIDLLRDHTILCGLGRTGQQVQAELAAEGMATVVVERDEAVVARLFSDGVHVVEGDATRDEVLLRAGVQRARAVIAVAGTDATNLMIALSVRDLCPSVVVAARADHPDAAHKLRRAGAHYVVQTHGAGAMHLALAVTHPVVHQVLDLLIPRQGALDLGQVEVGPGDGLEGRALADLDAHAHGALVLAVQRSGRLVVPPDPSAPLEAGDVLVVAGTGGALRWLADLAGEPGGEARAPRSG